MPRSTRSFDSKPIFSSEADEPVRVLSAYLCYTTGMGIFRPAPVPLREQNALVDAKVRWILSFSEPDEIWLFGSAAQGEMTEASDIDLVVLCKDKEAIRSARRAMRLTPRREFWPQDLLFFVTDDFHERARIGGVAMITAQEGRKLYSRE